MQATKAGHALPGAVVLQAMQALLDLRQRQLTEAAMADVCVLVAQHLCLLQVRQPACRIANFAC